MTELSTTLRRVTVFQDRAQLFKDAIVSLSKGEHTLIATGVWSSVDRDTLQVGAGSGRDCCVLRSVQFTKVKSVKDVRPERAQLDEDAKELSLKIQAVNDRVTLANEALAVYEAVLKKVSNQGNETEYNTDHGDPDKWFEVLEFATDGIREHTAMKRSAEAELKQLKEENVEINKKRNKLGSSDTQITEKDVAEIQVKMLKESELHLQISYVVRGPSWTPVYDLRVDSNSRTMDVTYNATVKQATEESWENIVLELSTAKAQYGASPPKAREWKLDFYRPPPPKRSMMSNREESLDQLCDKSCSLQEEAASFQMSAKKMKSRSLFRSSSRPAAAAAPMSNMMQMHTTQDEVDDEEDVEDGSRTTMMATQAATVTQSSTSATFAIAGLNSVKNDGEAMKCTIVQDSFKGYFRYSAVPKLSGHSYLKVECTNKTPYTMLPGATHVFADNQYVASSTMSLVAPDEKFWTFVGIDDAISIKRELIHRKTSTEKGWMSKTEGVNFKYKFTVNNKKKTSEEIVIWDQLPIVDNKKISLTLNAPTAEGVKANKDPVFKIDATQFVEWMCQLKPGEKQVFDFDFTMEYPGDHAVTGADV